MSAFSSIDAGEATTDFEKVLVNKGQKLESELAKYYVYRLDRMIMKH
jgi:hypothetical protein